MSDSLAVFENRRSQAQFDEARRQVQAAGASDDVQAFRDAKNQGLKDENIGRDKTLGGTPQATISKDRSVQGQVGELKDKAFEAGEHINETISGAVGAGLSAIGVDDERANSFGSTLVGSQLPEGNIEAALMGLPLIGGAVRGIKKGAKAAQKMGKAAEAGTVQHGTALMEKPAAPTIQKAADLKKVLPKRDGQAYAILTEENPAKKKVLPDGQLESLIQKSGYEYFPLQGMYKGIPEGRSFLVVGPVGDKALLSKAEAWGRAAGQESIITQHGMKNLETGLTNPNTGGLTIGEEATKGDFYSTIQMEEGDVPFSIHYDFDNSIPDPHSDDLIGVTFSDSRFRQLPPGQFIDAREKLPQIKDAPPLQHEVRFKGHAVYDAEEDMLGIAGNDEALKEHGFLAEKIGPVVRSVGPVNADRIINRVGNKTVFPEQLPQRVVAGLRDGKFDASARKDLRQVGAAVLSAPELTTAKQVSDGGVALAKGQSKSFDTRTGQTLKFKAADDLTDADLQTAIAYLTAPNDAAARGGWDKLISQVEKQFEELQGKVNVEFVDGQPYKSSDEMFADINAGTLKISKDFNEHPTFTPEQNLKFRAVHDMEGHSVPGNDFSMRGEQGAFDAHASTLADPEAVDALKVEVLGQAAASLAKNGKFPEQKIFSLKKQNEELGLVHGAKADLFESWRASMEERLPEEARGKISPEDYKELFRESVDAYKDHLDKTQKQIPSVKSMLELLDNPEGKKYSTWYVGAFDELRANFGEDADMMAKFIALLSPQNPVDRNVEWAFKAYRLHKLGHSPDEIISQIAEGAEMYRLNMNRMFSGEEFSGRKVQNFYSAIKGDPEAVVIDGWMAKIEGLADGKVNEKQYSFIEERIRMLARETGDTPANVQANLWVSKKVVDGLKPNEKIELLKETIARHGAMNKDLLASGARLDESGRANLGLIWFMTKVLSGGAIGGSHGEDTEQRIKNALIGMGLGAVVSPKLIGKVARTIRENVPPMFVKKVEAKIPIGPPPSLMTAQDIQKAADAATLQMQRLEALRNQPKTVTIGTHTYELDMKALDSPEAMKAAVDEMAKIYHKGMSNGSLAVGSRGVIPNALAKRLGEHLGITEQDVLSRVRGHAGPVEEVFAYADVLDAAKQRVSATQDLFKAGNVNLGPMLLKDVDRYITVGQQLDGLLEETGRALQAAGTPSVKALTGGVRNLSGPYELLAKGGTLTADTVSKLVDKIGLEGAAQAGKAIEKAGLWDMTAEVIYGFTLSNPRTNVVNTASGSVLNPVLTMLARSMAEAAGGEVMSGEARAMWYGYMNGVRRMAKAVSDTYKDGGAIAIMRGINNPPPVGSTAKRDSVNAGHAITGKNVANLEILGVKPFQFDPTGPLANMVDFAGSLIRFPSNLLELGDHLGYAVNFDMAANARAFREGMKQGKTGAALEAFMEAELKNPSGSIRTEAKKFAEHEIFRSVIEGHTGSVVSGLGHPAMRPFITFVRTPVNIFKYNLEGVPLLNIFLKGVREDLVAGGARRDLAMAKMMIGSSVAALGGMMASEGRITGRGPENLKLRQLWLQDHQPYSVKIGDKWYGYNYFDPVASWFGMVADAHHLMEFDKDDLTGGEVAMALTLGFMRNFTNKTFAKDTFDFLNVLTVQPGDEAEGALKQFQRYAEGRVKLVVPSVLRAAAGAIDPTIREGHGMVEKLMEITPWASQGLPEMLDFYGDPIVRPRFNSFLPFPMKNDTADPVMEEIIRTRARAGMPSKMFDGQELSAQDYHDLVEVRGKEIKDDNGKGIREQLIDLFETDFYKAEETTDKARALAIEKLVEGFNQAAYGFLAQHGNDTFFKYRQAQKRAEELTGQALDLKIGQ